jgi:selenide,water dikinase
MKIDLAKRRRVMELSQQLGHCICDPRRPCPCDVFRDDGICPCAGERPDPVDLAEVKLTALVHNAGCASKIPPGDLDAVLARLPAVQDPAVVSGLAAGDDAAIYRIAPNLHLVQTVDVFTPCVDEPRRFGRICAANCLSDIYAMGGEPRTALSILAFPSEKLPGEVMFEMLAGAMEVFADAGVALVGGHSIKDEETKLGFAITGLIDLAVADALMRPAVGDLLVLTKPLGTGVLTFCQQIGRGHPEGLAAAQTAMAELNRAAAEAMREAGASACTDVTGFGLFAHLLRMLRAGGLTAQVWADAWPAFPGAVEALRAGVVPGAIERNREYVGDALRVAPDAEEARVQLGFDAQTSGGLLIAVAADRLAGLQVALARRGVSGAIIGRLVAQSTGRIEVTAAPTENPATIEPKESTMNAPLPNPAAPHDGCCADVFNAAGAPGTAAETQKQFAALMRTVQAGGVVDAKTKELILFSLVLLSRCQGCFDVHLKKARELGLTQAQLDEAAWCAIAMGGAPVRQFYQECLERSRAAAP